MTTHLAEQQVQKWKTVTSAITGWGRTIRLAILLLIMQTPTDVLIWLAVHR